MEVSLAGISLKNNLIAASSPLTESVERLKCCEAAHFSAAILKSCADYVPTGKDYGRRIVYVTDGYYADGSFESEILPIEKEVEMYCSAREILASDFLLIPSVCALSLEPENWITLCNEFNSLGAPLIQLDFFYLGNLPHDEAFYKKVSDLLIILKETLSCKIMPKINVCFDPDRIFSLIAENGITTVSLLDSIREDPDEKYHLHKGATSFFGPRQLPYTLHYLKAAKRYGLEVCAGGGISCRDDMEMLLRHGAEAIQVASYILNRNYAYTRDLLLENYEYDNNALLEHNPWCDNLVPGKCNNCGGCAKHIMPSLGNNL